MDEQMKQSIINALLGGAAMGTKNAVPIGLRLPMEVGNLGAQVPAEVWQGAISNAAQKAIPQNMQLGAMAGQAAAPMVADEIRSFRPQPSSSPVEAQPMSTPIPTQAMAAQPVAGEQEPTDAQAKKPWLWDFLKQYGVPIGAAVASAANPEMLPAAAGLATGWNEGQRNAKARQAGSEEKPVYMFDEESGEMKSIGKIPKDSEVLRKNKNKSGDFDMESLLASSVPGAPSAVDVAEQKAAAIRKGESVQEITTPRNRDEVIQMLRQNGVVVNDATIANVMQQAGLTQ